MRPASCAALALILAPSITLLAQQPAPDLESGTRLRLTYLCAPDGQPALEPERARCRSVGTLVQLDAGTIALTTGESTTSHGLNAVSRVEVSRGYRSHRLAGAGAGFLLGGAATFVVLNSGGSTSLCNRSANPDAVAPLECLGLSALGGLAGAGLGFLVGGFIRTERWQDVPLERLRVSLTPRTGGMLGLSLAVLF
jgi:hypothetical protein